MKIGYYCAALGTREQAKRLEVISNNIANTNTAGFKKDTVLFRDFMVETSSPRMQQGSMRTTDNPLNIALMGDGFLKVQTDQGVMYSRNGDLRLSSDGTVTTQEGWPVLSKNGPIRLTSSKVRISEDGQIFDINEDPTATASKDSIATIDLVSFPGKTPMTKAGNGYFTPADATAAPLPTTTCTVHQGALEQANFNVVEEMTQMIDTLRTYESYQKVLQSFDQIDSQLSTKLANPQ
jgi:flagellar basal-body rod protein FlgF